MYLYPGFRFVYILMCKDEQDFHEFRLELQRSKEFVDTWTDDDHPMFGMQHRTLNLDVYFYDPDEDLSHECLPLLADKHNPFIYAVTSESNAVTLVDLENLISRHKKLLKVFQTHMPARVPAVHFEPCWS